MPHRSIRGSSARARRPWRWLGIALVAALAVILVAIVLVWVRLAAFNDRVSTVGMWNLGLVGEVAIGGDRINTLVVGYGGPGHEGAYLTDSIAVVSIDPESDATTLIPIPRDLWVEGNPLMPANGKVNEAFALGVAEGGIDTGGERARSVVAAITGLDVQRWIAVDFTGFAAMVDAVGGVTVDNPTEFRYGGPAAAAAGAWDGVFPAGELTLTGEQALFYARTRYTDSAAESGDFARSVRQQRILSALLREVVGGLPGSIPAGLDVMDAADDHLRTNMSAVELAVFAVSADPDRRLELSEDVILEATTTSDGQYALVVIGRRSASDYEPLRQFIQDGLAEPLPDASQPATTGS